MTSTSPDGNPRRRLPIDRTPAFHFVGGKGGGGKTTCAAAFGLASARSGARTLVISTDPAPSLGDAFGQPLGGAPRRVASARGHLDAVEIDARAALTRWLRTRRPVFEQMALRGTWLDEDDVSRLLQLSLPGIDEIAALLEIARFSAGRRYEQIVVDTAPTGHTLRMFGTPAVLRGVASVFKRCADDGSATLPTRWSPTSIVKGWSWRRSFETSSGPE